jgi:hypothetical protein
MAQENTYEVSASQIISHISQNRQLLAAFTGDVG